jgi:hypothetical protein
LHFGVILSVVVFPIGLGVVVIKEVVVVVLIKILRVIVVSRTVGVRGFLAG